MASLLHSLINRAHTKCRSVKTNYQRMSPKGKWEILRKIINATIYLAGLPVIDREFKPWWLSYIAVLLGADYVILTVYTFWKLKSEPMRAFPTLCLYGLVVPALLVYAVVIIPTQRKRFQNLVLFAGECIYKDEYETKRHREISGLSVNHLMTSSIKVLGIVTSGLIGFLAVPAFAYFFMHQRPMPIPLLLPFIDAETDYGYLINIAHQSVFGIVGGTAILGIELVNCMLKNNIYAAKESIIYSLDVLETMLKQDSTFSSNKKAEFRNVLVKIQDLDRFLLELCDIYYWKFFLQPTLLAFSVSAAIFCFYVGGWISGAGVALLCYTQIFILCDIGNEAQNANQELLDAMYAMPWYLMPRKYALMVQHTMVRLQNGGIIRMGPFAPLNYETAWKLTKNVYTFVMMLLRMVQP